MAEKLTRKSNLHPKEIVCRFVDAFNAKDVQALMELYHEDAVNHRRCFAKGAC